MSVDGPLKRRPWIAVGVMAVLALIPLLEQPFYQDVVNRMMILAMAAVTLNLILGYGGMVSFGHAAIVGIGAYCVGIPAHYEVYSGILQFCLAMFGAGLFALITGAICLRTKGVYFIMITMAFAQMLFYAFVSIETFGGDDGLVIEQRSDFGAWLNLEDDRVMYYFTFFCLLALLLVVRRIMASPFGRVIEGTKWNERRMRSIGFNTYRYRLVCYTISGALCGFAGALLGNFTNFISPEMMDWTRSGDLIFMVVLGGAGSWLGPVVGAGTYLLLEEVLSSITVHWQIIFGTFLIVVVLFVPGGIDSLFRRRRRLNSRPHDWPVDPMTRTACPMTFMRQQRPGVQPMLSVVNLRKCFGAVVAADDVDLVVHPGEIHAIIGPNGAGKTTLVAQVAGEMLADAGRIEFLGRDITRMPAYQRCLLGMGRSFQITSVFLPMTLLDNVALAAQAHAGSSFRFWRAVRADRRLNDRALDALRAVGLDERADVPAGELSHGEHRQLEIAMALVAKPRLLVLDEPMAGMGPEESWRMVDILRDLKGAVAILWIEHDMDAVFALADRVSVMVYGRVLASGAPEIIRSDALVREAYLGDEAL